MVITDGACTDCTQAGTSIEVITAEHLLADKGYEFMCLQFSLRHSHAGGNDEETVFL
jgi:hypothetical protein